MTLKTQYL